MKGSVLVTGLFSVPAGSEPAEEITWPQTVPTIEDFLVITGQPIFIATVIMKYGLGLWVSLLTGKLTGIGRAQVRHWGETHLIFHMGSPHMTCTQPMRGGQAGMTWLTCVISCLSDQQAIMTWQERVLTDTHTNKQGRAVVTSYPGGNANIARHVMLMRIHWKGIASHITTYHIELSTRGCAVELCSLKNNFSPMVVFLVCGGNYEIITL